jgi:hypothetical protein
MMAEAKRRKLSMKVDGKDIPMHNFVEKIICSTIIGMISSLKGVDIHDNLDLEIKIN